MTTLIIGGTGFIGRRLIPLLAKQGEDSVVMDINPQTANFSEESVANLLQALRAVRFDGSRSGSDRILARIALYARSGRRPASRSPAVARFQYLR